MTGKKKYTSDPNGQCPCFSGNIYDKCCRPFHQGKLPESALQLMRSRYSAYALDIPDYIMATTHPSNSQYSENTISWGKSISEFSRNFSFEKLEILDSTENSTVATVTFKAYLLHDGSDASFTEKSYFEKVNGRWLYFGSI